MRRAGLLGITFLCAAAVRLNADGGPHTLFNPTPRAQMRDMSTDRPDTTESPFTLDAGHFQLELSFLDFTYDHRNDAQKTGRALAVAPFLFKLGLLDNVDLQIGTTPFTHESTTDRPTGVKTTADGFGDTTLRLKINLWGNDGGQTACALMPYVTLPTGDDDLTADHVEGGLIIPFAVSLTEELDLGTMAQIDVIRSQADDRYVIDFVHTVTLGFPIRAETRGYVEYAGFANLNGDDDYRAYFDAGLTHALTPDMQLDAGLRLGLTRAADDLGLFLGLSLRY